MKKITLLPIFLLSAGLLAAQEINITSQEIPSQAQFAQPFEVHFALSHTPNYQVEIDEKSIPADFALLNKEQTTLSPGTVAFDLTFLPVNLGISTFTAVNFLLKDANQKTIAEASSEQAPVEIAEVQFFKDPNMRDIRPPYIPHNWLIWLLCLLVLALLIYFIRRFWKDTRSTRQALPTVQDLRPADVIALDKIHVLLQSGLWEKAQYKLFYTELENILREYIWRRFQLDVSSDTSLEMLRRIRKIPQLSVLQSELRTYLNSSDLVKFAKVIPDESTMQQDVCSVRTVVQTTSTHRDNIDSKQTGEAL